MCYWRSKILKILNISGQFLAICILYDFTTELLKQIVIYNFEIGGPIYKLQ